MPSLMIIKTFIPYALLCVLLTPLCAESSVLHVPRTHPTIQSAIDAAAPLDTVLVAPGLYQEKINFYGKKITVKSAQGPQNTVIDGLQSGPVVTFKTGEDLGSVLDGFTICNGTGVFYSEYPNIHIQSGGGIYCSQSSPTIRNNIIRDNYLEAFLVPNRLTFGAGICCSDSSPLVEHNHILNNQIRNTITTMFAYCGGGGIAIIEGSKPIIRHNLIQGNRGRDGHGIFCLSSSPEIRNNRILENRQSPTGVGMGGGGVACIGGAVTLMDNLISKNYDRWGGGLYVNQCDCLIQNNTITSNESMNGGGILYTMPGQVKISNNLINGNRSENSGGGIFCSADNSIIIDNIISDNTAGLSGGGVALSGADDSQVISHNVFTNNTATTGGGVSINGASYTDHKPLLIANILKGNKALDSGGGVSVFCSTPRVINNLILKNETIYGGGVYCDDASPVITNNTISMNTALRAGGICCKNDASPKITNTILWGNQADYGPEIFVYLGSPLVTYSNVKGGWPGVGNINKDPLFVDPSWDDFHLRGDSPCKDAGDNGAMDLPLEDFEGDPRMANSVTDMGADEFYAHLYLTGDPSPGEWMRLCITGAPQTGPVMIWASLDKLDPPMSTPYGEWFLTPPLLFELALGVMPVSGFQEILFRVPLGTPPLFFLQGAASNTLTNLCQWIEK